MNVYVGLTAFIIVYASCQELSVEISATDEKEVDKTIEKVVDNFEKDEKFARKKGSTAGWLSRCNYFFGFTLIFRYFIQYTSESKIYSDDAHLFNSALREVEKIGKG